MATLQPSTPGVPGASGSPRAVGAARAPRARAYTRGRTALALLALALACLCALPRGARAQATAADTAAILLDAAGRLTAEGRAEAASAILEYLQAHYAATPAGAEAARRLAATPPGPRPGRTAARGRLTGRTELIVWGTTYGIGLGLATPAAVDANSSEAYGLGLLLGAPTGYIVSRLYADRVGVTEGAARAITFGGTWGGWQGYGIARLAGLLDHTNRICPDLGQCFESTDVSGKAVVRSMIVGSLAGIAAGAAIGQGFHITPGQATTVNLAALWGTAYGGAGSVLLGATDGKKPLLLALLGGDAALLGAAAASPVWRLTRERARLISIAGLAGALAGGGVDLILRVDDDKVAMGIPVATATAGLILGAASTRSMPPEALAPAGQGGGAPGGALLGVGGGRVELGLPSATPVWRRAPQGRSAGVYLPLLAARF